MNFFRMKTGGRLLVFLMAMALIFVFAACEWTDLGKDKDKEEEVGASAEVDWTNYTTSSDRAFQVRNNTSKRLVAFKGSLALDNILGGIPNNANGHGIKRNPALLFKNEDFPMILITEEDYIANKANLATLEQTPFTRVYVFYNTSGDNDVVYDISSRLGGNKIILIGNNSPTLNVEIRLGGIYGETIGYAPAGKLTTRLFVTDGDFDLFPVFKRYNAQRDVVETIYPRGPTGIAYFKPLAFDDGIEEAYFNVSEAQQFLSNITSGVAWLSINNQSSGGAVHLVTGDTIVRTTTGVSYFNSGTTRTFPINMPNAGTSFASSITISSYRVGPSTYEVPIKTADGVTTFTLQADTLYTVTVTGSAILGNLEAVIDIESTVEVPPEAL